MSQKINNSKRIAKNTLLLYTRMLLMMVISLFTSRIILEVLGVEDYGIYNAVGGLVMMLSIISGSLSVAISRFITIEVGKGDQNRLNTIFSTSIIILAITALAVCIFAESIGVWFLNSKMNIPTDRIAAANWVFQLSILTFVVNLISTPYNALIIAYEKMSIFTYISTCEVVLKLIIAYMLYISPIDRLIFYVLQLLIVAIIIRFIYARYCNRCFNESNSKLIFDKQLIKQMFSFVGWAFCGNGAVVLKEQGVNVLLNIFCGPAVNAARGIALQVNTAVYNFVSNFIIAVQPQITKLHSVGELESMHNLVIKSAKYSFFILLILLLPLCANINYVLGIWLVEVPEHTANFVILVLVYSLFDCYASPLITGVLAQGDIKKYEINLTLMYLLNFVLSYIVLKYGMAPEWVFGFNIIFKMIIVGALLLQSRIYGLSIMRFIKECVLVTLAIFVICATFIMMLPITSATTFWQFVVYSATIVLFSLSVIFLLGINKSELSYIKSMITSRFSIKRAN